MHVHVHPHQQLHEGTFAVNADLVTTDDVDELLLRVDGAADGIDPSIVAISTRSQEVRDHQQAVEARIRIILNRKKKF